MSALIKLSTKLPGDEETNGLDAQVGHLLDNPQELLVAVVWLDVAKVTEEIDSGATIPTVRVRRIEPLGATGDVSAAIRDLIDVAVEKRTGRRPIPFDIAEVVAGHDPDQLTIEDGGS